MGAVLLGLIIDMYGRKMALVTGIVPATLGWLLISSNVSAPLKLLARGLTGITTGAIFYPAQVYVAECITVNHPHLRSSFITWGGIPNAFGILMVFLLSPFFNYLDIAKITAGLSIVLLLLICVLVPESPVWLYLQGRIGDAEMSQKKLGIIQPILGQSCANNASQNIDDMISKIRNTYFMNGFKKLTRKDVYKPLFIMSVAVVLSNCTGGFVLLAYMVQIIQDNATGESFLSSAKNSTSETGADVYMYSIISGILILASRFVTALVLPILGAKKLTVSSVAVMIVGLLVIGSSAIASNANPIFYYLNVAGIWIASFAFHAGVYSIPLSILSDVFPADAKGFAGIPLLIVSVFAASVVKLHPYLSIDFGGYVYFGYSIMSVVYAIFAVRYLPETVGKTLEEINAEFL